MKTTTKRNYENAILYTFHSGEEYAFVKLSLTNLLYEDAIYSHNVVYHVIDPLH